MSQLEKNKELIEGAMKEVMPSIMDMITNNKYPISIGVTPEGYLEFLKDGKTWVIDEDGLTNLKLFVNMYLITKDVQNKKPTGVVSSVGA